MGRPPNVNARNFLAGGVVDPMEHRALMLIALAALLAAAPPASAVFIETPLRILADPQHPNVGDKVTFEVSPWNESTRKAWAGRTVGFEVADHEGGHRERLFDVTLDDKAAASFSWTIPSSRDKENLIVSLVASKERLAFAHVPVGEAEPIAFTMGGGGSEQVLDDATPSPPPAPTPGPPFVAVALAAFAAALAMRRQTT